MERFTNPPDLYLTSSEHGVYFKIPNFPFSYLWVIGMTRAGLLHINLT
jgi:hypothetical protein